MTATGVKRPDGKGEGDGWRVIAAHTPHDSNEITTRCNAVIPNDDGAVQIVTIEGDTISVYMLKGHVYEIHNIAQINDTNTTATSFALLA